MVEPFATCGQDLILRHRRQIAVDRPDDHAGSRGMLAFPILNETQHVAGLAFAVSDDENFFGSFDSFRNVVVVVRVVVQAMFVAQVMTGLAHVVMATFMLGGFDLFRLRVLVETGCPDTGLVLSDGNDDEGIGVVRHDHLLCSDMRTL